jgi:hypothetical protein
MGRLGLDCLGKVGSVPLVLGRLVNEGWRDT